MGAPRGARVLAIGFAACAVLGALWIQSAVTEFSGQLSSVHVALTIIGPAAGGVVVARVGAAEAIAVDALWGLPVALASLDLHALRIQPLGALSSGRLPSLVLRAAHSTAAGADRHLLRPYGPFEVALPLYVRVDLHAGTEPLGFAWAAFGLGALIGDLAGGALFDPSHGSALRRFSVAVVAGGGL